MGDANVALRQRKFQRIKDGPKVVAETHSGAAAIVTKPHNLLGLQTSVVFTYFDTNQKSWNGACELLHAYA